MVPYWDVVRNMPSANEYIVKAVPKDDCMWRECGRYGTRNTAMHEVERMIGSGDYKAIGIEPHVIEAGSFQTSPLQEVWVA